jgi:hypothetical protein
MDAPPPVDERGLARPATPAARFAGCKRALGDVRTR